MNHRFMLATAALALFLGASPAFADPLAHLTSLSGDVEVMLQGQSQWQAAKEDEELSAGDSVKTGAQSGAFLIRKDGSTVQLLPFAQMTISNDRGFFLTLGQIWSHFTHAVGSPYFIRTPNATALIRGTILGVDYENGQSRVAVTRGLVEVQDAAAEHLDVPAGYHLEVNRLGHFERLERIEEREMNESQRFQDRRFRIEGRFSHFTHPGEGSQRPGDGPRHPERMREMGPPGPEGDRFDPSERLQPHERLMERQDRQEDQQERMDFHARFNGPGPLAIDRPGDREPAPPRGSGRPDMRMGPIDIRLIPGGGR